MLNRMPLIARPVRCFRAEDEDEVQNGLAMTPAEMARLAAKGIPVSPPALGVEFYDGRGQEDFDIDPIYQRGVDITDVYMASESSKERIRQGMKKIRQAQLNNQQYAS